MFSQAMPISASPNQARYVRAELAGLGTYMIAVGHRVDGPFDKSRFIQAAEALVARHDALRTSFDMRNQDVLVKISEETKFRFHHCALSDDNLPAFREWALPHVFDDVNPREPGSLIRFLVAEIDGGWRFTIAAHHAITDGFSRGVMNKELLKLYAGEDLPPVRSYYDFSLPPDRGETPGREALEFVRSLPNPCRFYADGSDDGDDALAGQIAERDFGDLNKGTRVLGKSIGATKFGVLTASFALGLHGFTGELGVASFFQTEGRKALDAPNSVVGPFSNTLPLDLSVDLEQDFASFARTLSGRVQQVVELEKEPILDLTFEEQKAPTVSINMFPPASRIIAGELQVGPREFLDRRAEFDLNLVLAEDRNAMIGRAFFNGAVVSRERAGLFLEHQERLLRAAVENPEASCREILKLARVGREAVALPVRLEPKPNQRLHEPFFDHAASAPEDAAIITTEATVTYGQLSDRALAVMEAVLSAGAAEGDKVAILAKREPQVVANILGVSASGASFALVDASYPPERIKRILDRLDTRFVVDAGDSLPDEIRGDFTIIKPLASAQNSHEIIRGAPRQVAYHLFTSGTSGEPKLISRPDTTTQRFTTWQTRTLSLSDPITTILMSGLAHDPMLRDVFLPFGNGGSIAIPTPCEMAEPDALRTLFRTAQCNVVRLGVSSARLLTAGTGPKTRFDHLKAIFWGGERLPPVTVRHWHDIAPNARQFNVFGTTETPQAFLVNEIDPEADHGRSIPIGHPLPYTGVRIVADDGSPVAIGEVGEIVAELADPVVGINQKFPNDRDGSTGQHYTGDLGFQMADGSVHYIGRSDHQVSLNGFRVELGEVEGFAESVPGVDRACAVLSTEKLHLFVLSEGQDVTESKMRSALARNLPSYMMPVRIVVTKAFPFTVNGKIDKDALLATAQESTSQNTKAAAQLESDAERAIAAVLSRRSGRGAVYRDHSLFDLGADSLSTIEARLELEELGIALPDKWQWMNVAELAELIPAGPSTVGAGTSLLGNVRIETMVLLRAIAIIIVVAHHNGFHLGIGASIALFALAGFSFGRLQLPGVLQDDHSGRIWALVGRLVVPLFLVVMIYTALNAYRGVETHPSSIWFYRNLADFIDLLLLGKTEQVQGLLWLWFLHAYIQIFAIFGILLSFPKVRRILRQDTWRSFLVFFIIIEVLSIALVLAFYVQDGDFYHVAALLQYAPTSMMPFIIAGALAASADTQSRRMISLGCAFVHFAVCQSVFINHAEIWWVVGIAVSSVFPFVPLPKFVSKAVLPVAAFSLMIYLTHVPAQNLFGALLGSSVIANMTSGVLQVLLGIALGMAMRPALDRLGINGLAAKKISF